MVSTAMVINVIPCNSWRILENIICNLVVKLEVYKVVAVICEHFNIDFMKEISKVLTTQ